MRHWTGFKAWHSSPLFSAVLRYNHDVGDWGLDAILVWRKYPELSHMSELGHV